MTVSSMGESALLLRRLERPKGKIDVVLDTDAYNEIDDQYAIGYLLHSGKTLCTRAIYAAPFSNQKVSSPAEGMRLSYEEILHILALDGRCGIPVLQGSDRYLPSESEEVPSPAARDLAQRAEAYSAERPLYVVAIGAATNVASALLLNPAIREKIVVVWLGGHAHHWPHNREFNLYQDIAAARILFGCGVPLVQLPCQGVVSAFTLSGPELWKWLHGKNPLCSYLVEHTQQEAERAYRREVWTRPIWDVAAVAWLLSGDYMADRLTPSPIPQYDHHYSFDPTRHWIRYVYQIKRDNLAESLIQTLTLPQPAP